jgi:hypothetical protein
LIQVGVLLVAARKKISLSLSLCPYLSLSLHPSLLLVADRRSGHILVCVLVWFRFVRGFGFYFDLCSLWHTGPSIYRLFLGTSMIGDVEVRGWGGCLLLVN